MSPDTPLINATAVLFAGGKSSRMQHDKSLLSFGGYPTLSEYQYRRLKKIFRKVYISTKERKFDFDAPLILDRYTQSSPLVGLASIFESLPDKEIFVLSVDAPFVDSDIINKLYEAKQNADCDIMIAQSPARKQPLCGIYGRSILKDAQALIAEEKHKLGRLLEMSKSCFVLFEEDAPFENLNHPHEYSAALLRAAEEKESDG